MTHVSLIIPTRDRPQALSKCLQAIFPSEQCEIIIADDSQTADTRRAIAEQCPSAKWIDGPQRGPAANRNAGAKAARNPWLIFLDDDCQPAPGWLQALLRAMEESGADVIEGKTVCPNKRDSLFQEQVENPNGDLYWSCNLAIRRTAFDQLGGFDEDFTEPGGEDLEFAWRIRRSGLTTKFVPQALVFHPPRELSWRQLWSRTLFARWHLLYKIKTEQTLPLRASAIRTSAALVCAQIVDLVRTSAHLFLRFESTRWRSATTGQLWRWLTLPALLPYLVCWDLRFRRSLAPVNSQRPIPSRQTRRAGVPALRPNPLPIRVSVALVSRDRPDRLARCLESWRAQDSQPYEIVVSDDSNPSSARAVQELAHRYSCRYVAGPRRGLYANRNQASLHCQGTHIISGDDDHTHPPDYLSQIKNLIELDPERIWIFGERDPNSPCAPVQCPPELHPSGAGQSPANPGDCAAIADGASVYPRRIFESGLRYDESYPFGSLWYLWGQQLTHHGWRITFSPVTFVWHHIEPNGPLTEWNDFNQRLEAGTYVAWTYALWLNNGALQRLYALLVTTRRVLWPTRVAQGARARLTLKAARRAFRRALDAGPIYRSPSRSAPGVTVPRNAGTLARSLAAGE